MTEMFGEAWSPMSVPDLAPDDDDDLFKKCALQLYPLTYAHKANLLHL